MNSALGGAKRLYASVGPGHRVGRLQSSRVFRLRDLTAISLGLV